MGVRPIEKRLVPSGITPLPWVARIAVHRLVLRERHDLHCRHSGVYSGMTWSPLLSVVTPGPMSTTTPAPSWPRIAGNSPSGSPPERVNSSVWQIPVALISTRTSPAVGPASWTFSMLSGLPASQATAARTSISLLLASRALQRLPHAARRRRHVEMRDATRAQCIEDRVHHRGRRPAAARLADALNAQRIRLCRHVDEVHLCGDGEIGGARHGVV